MDYLEKNTCALLKIYILKSIFRLQLNHTFLPQTLYALEGALEFIYLKFIFKKYVLVLSVVIKIMVMHSICPKCIKPKLLFQYIFFKLFQVDVTLIINLKCMFLFFVDGNVTLVHFIYFNAFNPL